MALYDKVEVTLPMLEAAERVLRETDTPESQEQADILLKRINVEHERRNANIGFLQDLDDARNRRDIFDLAELQFQCFSWSLSNFGHQPSVYPLMGVSEETGEAMHAKLKMLQGIRGDSDEHYASLTDAMADILIYLCDVASREGVHLQGIAEQTWKNIVSKRNWAEHPEDADIRALVAGEDVPLDENGN